MAVLAASLFAATMVSVQAQTTTTAPITTLPVKKNIYPTVITPDLKLPTVVLTNDQGQQIYLRLKEYADGNGGSVLYSKFKAPAAPELTLNAGQVFKLKFIDGTVPQTADVPLTIAGEDSKPIVVSFDPSGGSDVVIRPTQLAPNDINEARFWLDTHVSASDDESGAAKGQEEMFVTINYGDDANNHPQWVNYYTIVNIAGSTAN